MWQWADTEAAAGVYGIRGEEDFTLWEVDIRFTQRVFLKNTASESANRVPTNQITKLDYITKEIAKNIYKYI